jgi:very-short-patch-repair endonuclease
MSSSIRWTPEQLTEYERKKTRVRTNLMEGSRPDRKHGMESKLERRFVQQLTEAGFTDYQRNYFPITGRDWELDFCWPSRKMAVEIDGMAHRTKGRFKADFQKHAALLLAGWLVLRVCGDDIRQGRAINWTKDLLE